MSDHRALSCAATVLAHLRAGDALVRNEVEGWRLLRTNQPVSDDAVKALRIGSFVDVLHGSLAPMGDCPPGLKAHDSRTWRWAEATEQRLAS